jgi:hypothetical protein
VEYAWLVSVRQAERVLLQVYAYYSERGFLCSVASRVTHALYVDSFWSVLAFTER